jgi:hypothetical protein
MRYELRFGSYYLMDGETILNMCDEVAIGYSYNAEENYTVLHKHGSKEMVMQWMDKTRQRYLANNMLDMANELQMICGKFPVEELTKIIENTGYLHSFLKKQNLLN